MPELPEMENYKRILSDRLLGNTITEVDITREKSTNLPSEQFCHLVKGRTLIAIDRRAKHLIFRLDSGKCLLLHLMLGGVMYLGNAQESPDRTKQIVISFGETQLFFIGLRLGYLHLLTSDEVEERLSDLGPEPLSPSFTEKAFLNLFERKRGALKTSLVNQKFIAGIGNLYSDEICFDAKLLPKRKVNDLTEQELRGLYQSIQSVLERGLSFGGYMDMPVYEGDTLTGQYNSHCYVYDKEGETCERCQSLIIRDEISSRKTFFCANCQF